MQLIKYLTLLVMIFLYVSCNNSNEPIENELKEEDSKQSLHAILFPASDTTNNIKVIFSQLDSIGYKIGDLGTFDVQIVNSIPLNGSLKEKFVSNSSNMEIGVCNLGGNINKDIVIFIIIYDNINNKIIDDLVLNPKILCSQNTFNKINLRTVSPKFSGTIYAFYVDGIGDKLDAPVQITLYEKNSKIKSFVLEPKNSLSPKFALHIDGSKKQTFFEEKSNLQIQHIITKNNTTNIPIPIFINCLNNEWNGHVVYSNTLYGCSINEKFQRLDYFLFYIDF